MPRPPKKNRVYRCAHCGAQLTLDQPHKALKAMANRIEGRPDTKRGQPRCAEFQFYFEPECWLAFQTEANLMYGHPMPVHKEPGQNYAERNPHQLYRFPADGHHMKLYIARTGIPVTMPVNQIVHLTHVVQFHRRRQELKIRAAYGAHAQMDMILALGEP